MLEAYGFEALSDGVTAVFRFYPKIAILRFNSKERLMPQGRGSTALLLR